MTGVRRVGNRLVVTFDSGATVPALPSVGGLWLPNQSIDVTVTPTTVTPTPDPTPTPAPTGGSIVNPWASYPISGTWADHMSYSLGGIDYPLNYGTPLVAPAAGTLHTSGGTGEFQAGWVGTAGRRSILTLDASVARQPGRPLEQNEGDGDMIAVVVQHQSAFGVDHTHYDSGAVFGYSGASASGDDYGGQVHLHVHGLNASGQRVDFLNFIP